MPANSPTLRPQQTELCVVARVRNELEGAMVKCRLDAAGIESFTHGDFLAGFRAEAPGDVAILVRHGDRDSALRALSSTPAARSAG